MKINDLSKKYNISIRAIRYYEEIGLITSSRNSSNIREFNDLQIERLELILFFKNFNFTLHEIKNILSSLDITAVKPLFQNKMVQLDNEIDKLNNKKQILITVLDVLNKENINKINVKDFINAQIYFKKDNERMINMSNNRDEIMIEIGQNLIPLADKHVDGILLDDIPKMREELENQYNMKIELIRVRDNINTLSENQYRISKGKDELLCKNIIGHTNAEKSKCIIDELKSVLIH